jgi:hypothetical protein
LNRILQTTTDLASGNWMNVGALNWTNWSAGASQIGGCVTNAPAGSATFFRLR